MTQELHYTSVPRGLRPGSQGFCTVACTPRMPGPMVDWLEGLSGYQPVYPVHDPSAARNPVNSSHLRLAMGGRAVSVLSRVGPAGLDYSGRSNKYAHHVALEADERPEGGPAWLLSQPGFLQAAWEGDPRTLPEGRRPPRGDRPPGVAAAWKALTGDAGWAGVLAESFLADSRRPAILVFRPGMDVLPLFVEAIALLPTSRRWDVEFSTYFTTPQRGMVPTWRGMVEGTPETGNALRLPGALIFHLGEPSRAAEGGELVDQARTGRPRKRRHPDPSAAPVRASGSGPALPSGAPAPARELGLRIDEEPLSGRTGATTNRGPARSGWALVAGIVAAGLVPLGALAFLLRGPDRSPAASAGAVDASSRSREGEAPAEPSGTAAHRESPPPGEEVAARREARPPGVKRGDRGARPGADPSGPEEKVVSREPVGSVADFGPPDLPERPKPPPVSPAPATKAPRKILVFFPLREPSRSLSQAAAPESVPMEGSILREADVELLGAKGVGLDAKLEGDRGGPRSLVVAADRPGRPPIDGTRGSVVATFSLLPGDGRLAMSWGESATAEDRGVLRDCALVLRSREPAEVRSILLRGAPRGDPDGLRFRLLAKGSRAAYDLSWDLDRQFEGTRRKLGIAACRILGDDGEDVIDVAAWDDGSWGDDDDLVNVGFEGASLRASIQDKGFKALDQRIAQTEDQIAKAEQRLRSRSERPRRAAPADLDRLEWDLAVLETLRLIQPSAVHVVITWEVEGERFEIARSPAFAPRPVPRPGRP